MPDDREWVRARWAAVAALLIGVLVLGTAVAHAQALGIFYLYLAPTLLAAYWLGRRAAVIVGVVSTGLYGLSMGAGPQELVLPALLLRLVAFCGVGYLFARVLERTRRLAREVERQAGQLNELRVIREALVPPVPPMPPGLDLASCYVPATQGVGGDFYVVSPAPDGTTMVVIGDVMGKGLEAARRASFVRASLSTFMPFTPDPAAVLELANRELVEREVGPEAGPEAFVTAACVAIRAGDREIDWALAGHPAPVWLDHGAPLEGGRAGVPLGVEAELGCVGARAGLPAGSGVVLFTDGVVEAHAEGATEEDGEDALFGSERLSRRLADLSGASAGAVVEGVKTAAEAFSGGTLVDDLCIVAVRT
jgi:serine phosphatase RsbU (regulator of sigma subunit)